MTEHLFIDFVNSELFDGSGNREDRLPDPAWRRWFLERWGLQADPELSERDLEDLSALRAAVRSMIDGLAAGKPPAPTALRRLDARLATHPVLFRLRGDAGALEVEAVPLSSDAVEVIAGEVALSVARFLEAEDLRRLKACTNAGCRWVFHDETKNRNRRWCRQCGNVDRVRRFRERQRSRTAALPGA